MLYTQQKKTETSTNQRMKVYSVFFIKFIMQQELFFQI